MKNLLFTILITFITLSSFYLLEEEKLKQSNKIDPEDITWSKGHGVINYSKFTVEDFERSDSFFNKEE